MRAPRSYIVRIYRRGYLTLAGTVEEVCTGRRSNFASGEELCRMLRIFGLDRPVTLRRFRGQESKTNGGSRDE